MPQPVAWFVGETQQQGFFYVICLYTGGYFAVALAAIFLWGKDEAIPDNERWCLRDSIDVLKHPATWYLGIILFFVYSLGRTMDLMSVYTTDVMGIDPGTDAVLNTIRVLIFCAIGGVIVGWLVDRSKDKIKTCQYSMIIAAIFYTSLRFIPVGDTFWNVVFFSALAIAVIFGFGVFLCTFSLLDLTNIPMKITGRIIGVSISIGYLPDIVINYLTNYLADTYGFVTANHYLFLISGANALISVFLLGLFRHYVKKTFTA